MPLRDLDAIAQRARSVGQANCVHVPTALQVAHRDVPRLLEEIRKLHVRLAGGVHPDL